MWDESELVEAWLRTSGSTRDQFELQGVTFHGPGSEPRWVAFTYSEQSSTFGPEGSGSTALEALAALRSQLERES
jgi:hypothetical protein